MKGNGIRFWSVVMMVGAAAWLAGCADTAPPEDDVIVVVRGALDPCVAAPPVVVETREEQPGPVAPGITGQPLQQCFTASGDHHATANLTSSACVRYRTL